MFHASCTELAKLSPQEFWRFMNCFDTVLTTCDGVLWNYNREIKGASTALNKLREIGKDIFFLTNNSLRTRQEVVKHAEKFQYIIYPCEVLSVGFLTAHYLSSMKFDGLAYVVGSKGLGEELDEVGIKHIGIGPDSVNGEIEDACDEAEINANVKAVIVGLDEHFSFMKIIKAATYLSNPDCLFIAVSREERRGGFYPKIVPAAGSLLASIETCTGRKARVLGKPSKFTLNYLTRHHCVDPQRTLLIGHRLIADSLYSFKCNFSTLLVLTGLTQIEEVRERENTKNLNQIEKFYLPNLYTYSLDDILYFFNTRSYKY